jgi:septal ring factor EnvC (AmiA/AmiB activator)
VIQFALLFGLGFLSAALLVMLIAPAIHGRIVRYTEKRIQATLPISPQEVRAQRDMARAVYAAENARTKQELVQERDQAVGLKLRYDRLAEEARRLQSDNHDLQMQINDMDVEAADLRSRLRQEDSYIQQLKAAVEAAEEADAAKGVQIDELQRRIARLTADGDNFRIDLSARDTEIENLKFRMAALRDEREAIRSDIKLQTTRAKDAENRLAQEEHRALRLEDKLSREISARTDKENALERRLQEIALLKDKLKTATAEARDASRSAGKSGSKQAAAGSTIAKAVTTGVPLAPVETAGPSDIAAVIAASPALSELADSVHNRATALSERLLKARSAGNDPAIREELAAIAAAMVALTARAEGPASPIHALLEPENGTNGGSKGRRESLAARTRAELDAAQEPAV